MVLIRNTNVHGEAEMPQMPTHYRFIDEDKRPNPGQTLCVSVSAYAKTSYPDKAFLVPNEYICNKLALHLDLPVPIGYLVAYKKQTFFCSGAAFGDSIDRPPARPRQIQSILNSHPHDVAGCLVFDCWTANEDRHLANIVCEEIEDDSEFRMIDHGEALFVGRDTSEAMKRLDRITQGKESCLRSHLFGCHNNLANIHDWVERVLQLPDFQIRNACRNAIATGFNQCFSETDAGLCANFLLSRRKQLKEILLGNEYRPILTHRSTQPAAEME